MVIPQIPHVVEGGTGMEDIDDDGDSTYMPESESESGSDIVSDFEYFAESDSLSDTCDPIGDEFEHMNNFKQVENCETDCWNVEVYENENQSDPETLLSPQNSDDEMIVGVRFPEFDEERDMYNPKLSIGLRFVNVTVFRKAIREYAIRAGFELKFLKNEKCRVTAVCKEPNCRFQKKAEWIGNYSGILCPRIQKKVDQNKLKSLDFEALKAGGGIWEIMSGSSSYVVDLERHKCSCREWDLTGIPCIHATCACLEDHKQPEWYVNSYYMVSKYKVAYSGIIHPVGDHNSWEFTEADSVMPPPYKRQPGRPKKARRRGPDEINNGNKVNKQGSSISCSNCGDKSHNKRSCKKPPSEKPMKKKNEQVMDLTDNVSRTVFAQTTEPSLTLSNESSGVGCSNNRGNRGRGRGRGRGKSKGKRPANGPQCGIGNWNGIGFFNMHNFIPANQEINRQGDQSNTPVQTSMWNSYTGPPTIPPYVTTSNPPQKSHIQRQASRYGDVFFSSQSSSNNFAVIRDGNEEFEFTGWGEK